MASTPKTFTDDELHASLYRLETSSDLQRQRAVEMLGSGDEVEAEADIYETLVPDLVDSLVVVDIINRVRTGDQR